MFFHVEYTHVNSFFAIVCLRYTNNDYLVPFVFTYTFDSHNRLTNINVIKNHTKRTHSATILAVVSNLILKLVFELPN